MQEGDLLCIVVLMVFPLAQNLLPEPQYKESVGDITFSVYRVKRLYNPRWDSNVLKKIVGEARKKYQLYYGDMVPLFDSYDNKAAVYLTLVQHKGTKAQKWYSLRFIPALGEPQRSEDIDYYVQYTADGKRISLLTLMRNRIRGLSDLTKSQILSRIVTHSRFCSTTSSQKSYGNYSGLVYALMNKQFINDLKSEHQTFDIMTCQLNGVMSDIIFSHTKGNHKVNLPLVPGHTQLKLEKNSILAINRNKARYAFPCPGYFLDLMDIVGVLDKLIQKGHLTRNIVEKHLPEGITFEKILHNPHIKDFRFMGKLLTHEGTIDGTALTGKKLRSILNEEVKDAPILHIMKTDEWAKGLDEFIEFIKR